MSNNLTSSDEWKQRAEEDALFQMELENVDKEAACQAALDILKEHSDLVMQLQDEFILSNRDMLTTSLTVNPNLPVEVKKQISMLSLKLQNIIWSVASQVESRKYEPYVQGLNDITFSAYHRKKATELVKADENINISLQAVKTTIGFFSKINRQILKEIEDCQTQGDVKTETKLILGNSILVYELANFTIKFLETFRLTGIDEISQIHNDTIKQIDENKAEIEKLKKDVALLNEEFKDQRMSALEMRTQSLEEIRKEWDQYLKKIQDIQTNVKSVSNHLPTLKFIRDDAKNQISLIEILIITRLIGDSLEAVKTLVMELEDIDLVPLPPETVRRLLGIYK